MQQGGTQQNIEGANDEETVASGALQAIIPFNPIHANIIQAPQPLIAQVVQEVGNPQATDPAMGHQGVHLILEEGITTEGLLNTFNQGLFTLHHRWANAFRSISTKLIQDILMEDEGSERAKTALFILPGMIQALTLVKSPKPADFLRKCLAPDFLPHLAIYIIQQAIYMRRKVVTMREKAMRRSSQASNSHHRRRSDHIVITRHKRRLEKLFREGRHSSSTRVLEQAHKSLKDRTVVTAAAAPPSLEQTREILLGFNPQATAADDLPSVEDDPEPGEPFLFDQAFVQHCVRDLPKGSANGASAWSYNIIHRLYAAPSHWV